MEKLEIGSGGKVVRFLTKDNVKLNGLLFAKPGYGKTCMIYLHGMGGSMISGISLALAQDIQKDISVFSFSNRGHDIVSSVSKFRGGRRKRLIAGLNYERFEDSVNDVAGAIDALSRLGYRKFVLCGHSTGCQKAIHYQYRRQDRRVIAVVLLGAADDYNTYKRELGRRYGKMLAECRRLMRSGKGSVVPDASIGFSAQRLDSVIDLERVEARILNYNGEMKEYASITAPILAIFGSEEEYRLMPIRRYLEILDVRSRSRRFTGMEIEGASHSFIGKEKELSKKIYGWICKL